MPELIERGRLIMNKTVIFLGAGASKADGAPLQRELFKSYFRACEDESLNKCYDLKNSSIKALVDSFFKNFFDMEGDLRHCEYEFPTFEEALGVLDLAIERNEKYRQGLGNLYAYRNALIFSMAQAIQFRISASTKGIHGESHSRLVDRLYDCIESGDVTFISTNYDIILDNALGSRFDKIDYGFFPMENVFENIRGPKLLKIHGSLNWKYCPVCNHIDAKIGEENTVSEIYSMKSVKCGNCGEDARYIIVPPTYYKDMSNVYLANIWNNAEKVLREAEHVVFSGYSLPSADMHIKYLLKRAELNRDAGSIFKATIINYYPDKIQGAVEKEKNRYGRLFKNSSEVKYIEDMSFQDFAENPFSVL